MCSSKSKCLGVKICWLLVVIGALNWGLVGIFDWNLVTAIFGSVSWLERLIYILVGIGGLCLLISCPGKECKNGKGGGCGGGDKAPESDLSK